MEKIDSVVRHFCDWLAATSVSQAFGNAQWFVPTIQTLHILSIAVVVATVALLDMRLLRLARRPSLSDVAGSYLPWVWKALIVLLVTGILLTITEPTRELMNYAFRYKMLMVVVLAILMLIVQRALGQDPGYWSASPARRWLGGAIGLVSLLLTISIVVAGRMIAYVG